MSASDDQATTWNRVIRLRPIGVVRSARVELTDDHWGGVTSGIELDPAILTAESVRGIEHFSHLEVVYFLHRVAEGEIETGSRHPRNRTDWPLTGILAQRAKRRPNRIGLSCCELLAVDGLRLAVRGLDAIDGTPVLDVKPYFREFAPRSPVRQPGWVAELMRDYFID